MVLATTAKRKVTKPKIAGQKVEARRANTQRGGSQGAKASRKRKQALQMLRVESPMESGLLMQPFQIMKTIGCEKLMRRTSQLYALKLMRTKSPSLLIAVLFSLVKVSKQAST